MRNKAGPQVAKDAGAKTVRKTAPERPTLRTRLDPLVRERMILDAAVDFFAEHGFEAQTKELADRIGVSQGLIFRYFGTKKNLVEKVYQRVFLQRWSLAWEEGLKDRSRPLAERITDFYKSYLDAVDEYHWIRLSLYASLAGHDIIARYIQGHVNVLLETIMRELRAYRGLPDAGAIEPLEYELAWHLHSTFIYILVRKYIHRMPVTDDKPAMVARIVANFLKEFEPAAASAPVRRRRPATVSG